jgi:hypothetical protein
MLHTLKKKYLTRLITYDTHLSLRAKAVKKIDCQKSF